MITCHRHTKLETPCPSSKCLRFLADDPFSLSSANSFFPLLDVPSGVPNSYVFIYHRHTKNKLSSVRQRVSVSYLWPHPPLALQKLSTCTRPKIREAKYCKWCRESCHRPTYGVGRKKATRWRLSLLIPSLFNDSWYQMMILYTLKVEYHRMRRKMRTCRSSARRVEGCAITTCLQTIHTSLMSWCSIPPMLHSKVHFIVRDINGEDGHFDWCTNDDEWFAPYTQLDARYLIITNDFYFAAVSCTAVYHVDWHEEKMSRKSVYVWMNSRSLVVCCVFCCMCRIYLPKQVALIPNEHWISVMVLYEVTWKELILSKTFLSFLVILWFFDGFECGCGSHTTCSSPNCKKNKMRYAIESRCERHAVR